MTEKKRFGKPRARDGQLKLQYGRYEGEEDHFVTYGDGIPRCDRALLSDLVSGKSYSPLSETWNDSFMEELEKRGYDLTTLKISVEKKKPSSVEDDES